MAGKSTTLKRTSFVGLQMPITVSNGSIIFISDFQRLYTPSAFREERVLWRAVCTY